MVAWHHQLDGHESEKASGDGDGLGGLACCSPWGRREDFCLTAQGPVPSLPTAAPPNTPLTHTGDRPVPRTPQPENLPRGRQRPVRCRQTIPPSVPPETWGSACPDPLPEGNLTGRSDQKSHSCVHTLLNPV